LKSKAEKKSAKNTETENAKKFIIAGAVLLISGFIVLSRANRMADNWAGFAAPVILVISWILIGVGLWKIEK